MRNRCGGRWQFFAANMASKRATPSPLTEGERSTLQMLVQGRCFMKHRRMKKPHSRVVRVSPDCMVVFWGPPRTGPHADQPPPAEQKRRRLLNKQPNKIRTVSTHALARLHAAARRDGPGRGRTGRVCVDSCVSFTSRTWWMCSPAVSLERPMLPPRMSLCHQTFRACIWRTLPVLFQG